MKDYDPSLVACLCLKIYRCAFATNQQSYDAAVDDYFTGVDRFENILANTKYLGGAGPNMDDIKIFCTLIRFDVAYYYLYKCNLKRMQDYPNVFRWLKNMYRELDRNLIPRGLFRSRFLGTAASLYVWGLTRGSLAASCVSWRAANV